MPALPQSASKKAKSEKMKEEMHKFKRGELRSGSQEGPVVEDRDQAIAIGLKVSGQSKYDIKRKTARKKPRGRGRR